MADQRLAVQKRLAGRWNPHDDVGLARQAVEQDLESGQQGREQRAALLGAEPLDRLVRGSARS